MSVLVILLVLVGLLDSRMFLIELIKNHFYGSKMSDVEK